VDVGQDTTLSNGNMSKQLVQFLIVADGKLEMARNDTGLLVVTGSVTSQLQDFSGEILKDSGQVNRSTYEGHCRQNKGGQRHKDNQLNGVKDLPAPTR
jgi:hypothetical protein